MAKAFNPAFPSLRPGAVSVRLVDRTIVLHDDREVSYYDDGVVVVNDGPAFSRGNTIHDQMVGPYHN